MEEYLDIVDENGNPTGEKELRSVVHEKGLWHKVAVVYFYRFNGDEIEFLTHLRSEFKEQKPNTWISRFGGHIISGSNSLETVLREAYEETGILINSKELIEGIKTYRNTPDDKQIGQTYYYRFDEDLKKISFPNNEVQEVKWMSEKEIERSMHNNPAKWAGKETYLKQVIEDLKSKI